MAGNLLGREVHAENVADAVIYPAHSEHTTGHVIAVDGDNIQSGASDSGV